MSNLTNICFICLKHSNNFILFTSQDADGLSFEYKLKCFLPGLELNADIPKYICGRCQHDLSEIYEFKQKCLQNIATYEKHAQQVTTKNGDKHFIFIRPDEEFIIKKEIKEENCKTVDTQSNNGSENKEIVLDIVNCDEIIIEEECGNIEETAQVNINISEQSDKGYKCLICDEKTTSELQCNDQVWYECKICYRLFINRKNLKTHQENHKNNEKIACKICKKRFKSKYYLKKHNSIHNKRRPSTCDICNTSVMYLESHNKRMHSGEKPFTCQICKESFRLWQELKTHKHIHTNTCEVCNRTFGTFSDLKTHKYIHTDENLQ